MSAHHWVGCLATPNQFIEVHTGSGLITVTLTGVSVITPGVGSFVVP